MKAGARNSRSNMGIDIWTRTMDPCGNSLEKTEVVVTA
jgi:hypothetical protein